jgi:DNA-binding protein H-NS
MEKMATYLEIKSQIDALQREADALKTKERKQVITQMREAIAAYEITAADLGLSAVRGASVKNGGRDKRGLTKSRAKRASGVAYVDSRGNTWGGRGKRPNWLREAIANGAKLEDFAAKK